MKLTALNTVKSVTVPPICTCVPSDQVDSLHPMYIFREVKNLTGVTKVIVRPLWKMQECFNSRARVQLLLCPSRSSDICTLGQVLRAFSKCARSRMRNKVNSKPTCLP